MLRRSNLSADKALKTTFEDFFARRIEVLLEERYFIGGERRDLVGASYRGELSKIEFESMWPTPKPGITGSADHDFLEDLILQASAAIEGWCRRVFGREEVTETFRLSAERAVLHLARWPNVSLASIGEDGVTLTADDWELDAATGELWRLDGADRRVAWPAAKIIVAYAAGYLLPGEPQRDLPEDLERACLEMVKARVRASPWRRW